MNAIAQTGQVLNLGSDVSLRRQFDRASFSHPAKLHLGLLGWIIDRYTRPDDTCGDPMAGVGSLLLAATVERNVILREIEPKWLEIAERNAARVRLLAKRIDIAEWDARNPWGWQADHIIFSPPYGCDFQVVSSTVQRGYLSRKEQALARLEGQSYSERWTRLFRQPASAGSLAAQQMFYGNHASQIGHLRGKRYWEAMEQIYTNALAALLGGYMVLVIKDHIADGKHVRVADQTIELCEQLGFALEERHWRRVYPLSLWQRRRKERGAPVIELEDVLAFRKR